MNPTERFRFDPRTQEILERLTIPFAIYQYIDKRVVTVAISQGFCEQFGFPTLEDAYYAMDSDMYRATHPDDKTRVADAAYRFAALDAPYDIVYRTRTLKDPDYIILHAYGRSVYPQPGVRLCLTWYASEGRYVPEQGTYESVLSQTLSRFLTEESRYRGMYYDYMTGLPNMAYFFELAEAGRKRMREQDIPSAVLFFDLTGLKQFNRRHGFTEGNRLICAVAQILARQFSSQSCARFAQDYFAAFAPEEGLREKLDAVLTECAAANGGKTLPLRVGVYPDRIEPVEISTACDRARLAADMRRRKGFGCTFFDKDMMTEEKNRQQIVDSLDTALEQGWIQVYYQPIVRSASGKVCDVEALARWADPERGLLMPSSFVPVLEETGLIHRLDLYVVGRVLRDLRDAQQAGRRCVPVSFFFSRSDFDACDLVQKLCDMTDKAQVDRRLLNVEITESMVGSDFDYMKVQIGRFRAQGFQVWMDDFGSGYSSLDVLQSLRFDLIKFDMGFMKRLDQGGEGKIILTELMRMATALGVDTVCEGVETREHARFLQEIGCSRQQGYYFTKPLPLDRLLEKYDGLSLGFEDPRESPYYDAMGGVNLYDLSFLANLEDDFRQDAFDTVPMGIMELDGGGHQVRFVRSNPSFREFMGRFFTFDLSDHRKVYGTPETGPGSVFIKNVRQCLESGNGRAFVDEEMADGSRVHTFVRRIENNAVTGSTAWAIAVLSVAPPSEGATYADIARALASDYYNIYVVDLDTEDYIEYVSQVGGEELSTERRGRHFFASVKRDAMTRIYEEDRESFLKWFNRESILRELDAQSVFTATYRLIDTGAPMYVNLKLTRMPGGNRIIIGISIVDAQLRQQEEEKKLRQERVSLGRIAALSPNYLVLYTADPVTGHYTQYSPSREYERFGLARRGEDFFGDVKRDAPKAIAPEDLERHLRVFTRENILREIEKYGVFVHRYRLLLDGGPTPVRLRATMVDEEDGKKLLLGVINENGAEFRQGLEEAYEQARSDSIIYTHIAQALARGYTDLYYVNMETDALIEYHTDDELGVLTEARRSRDFFEGCRRDVKLFVHPEDQAAFVRAMDRDFLEAALADSKTFEMTYRRIKNGRSFYVQMRVTRIEEDRRYIVIAVSDVDELMRKRRAEERIQEERTVYARLHAITGNFICVYVVDPDTNRYREFSATANYEETFAQAKEGTDFFITVREAARVFTYPEDLSLFLTAFTKENVMAEVGRGGIFTLGYRLMMDGVPRHIQMKAAMVEEQEGPRLVVGLNDIDAQVRQEEEFGRQLALAQSQANIDALTGVKNKHAYLEAEGRMDRQIAQRCQQPFAIVMLDVNDLKKVNDRAGHEAGDRYLCTACRVICEIFKRSPVFRIGGDEFAVIVQGDDYANLDRRLAEVERHNDEAARTGGVVIACGMSRFADDVSVSAVFRRADHSMYNNKSALKASMP